MSRYHLFSWGANSHGQLGQGHHLEQSILPKEVDLSEIRLDPENIRKLAGGAGHSLILDKDGRVYSCGWNSKGQAGISGEQSFAKFRILEELRNETIVDIACGWDNSIAIAESGIAYAWGSNSFGQLGKDRRDLEYTSVPFKITVNEKIVRGSLGLRHSALLTDAGKLLVTGVGSKCQLGLIDSENKPILGVNTFSAVPGLPDVVNVSCGQHHTVAATRKGELYSWGDNKHGQLGVNPLARSKVSTPMKLQEFDVGSSIEISTGWTHTIALNVDSGNILAWGRNTYGQLGYEKCDKSVTWKPSYIKDLPRIRQVSVGSEHNVALTEDGTVLSWGWNEHGNCGNGTESDVRVPGRVSLPRNSIGILIGSGAGHTFVLVAEKD